MTGATLAVVVDKVSKEQSTRTSVGWDRKFDLVWIASSWSAWLIGFASGWLIVDGHHNFCLPPGKCVMGILCSTDSAPLTV
jgi:hypothetical protein